MSPNEGIPTVAVIIGFFAFIYYMIAFFWPRKRVFQDIRPEVPLMAESMKNMPNDWHVKPALHVLRYRPDNGGCVEIKLCESNRMITTGQYNRDERVILQEAFETLLARDDKHRDDEYWKTVQSQFGEVK